MTKKRIHLGLEESLLAEIEQVRTHMSIQSRTTAVEMLLGEALQRRRMAEVDRGDGDVEPIHTRLWRRIRQTPVQVRVLLMQGGVLPKRATAGSAGFDLHASEGLEIPAQVPVAVGTGLRMEIPTGYEVQVRSRSGLALKGLSVLNAPGTIDSDYRGEVKVILFNHGMVPMRVEKGDRIAQGVIAPVFNAAFVDVVGELDKTDRGEGGFGSTGMGGLQE